MMKFVQTKFERRDSFEQAACETGIGYQNSLLIKDARRDPYEFSAVAIDNLPAYAGHSIAAIGLCNAFAGSRKLRVLDFGGALGYSYAVAQATFGTALKLDWTVLETEMYAEHGRRWLQTDSLKFSDSLHSLRDENFDLVHISGCLQYLSDPHIFDLEPIKSAGFLFIARTGIADEADFYLQSAVCDIGTIKYAGRIFERKALNAEIGRTHTLHTVWENDAERCFGELGQKPNPSMLWRRR